MSEQPVAPADAPKTADEPAEGVHPIVVNPDQPVFPRPVGVASDDLKAMGVDHGHVATSEELEAESGPSTEQEEGARPATEPEGKPRDPEAEKKAAEAVKVADANRVTAPAPGQPQGAPKTQ